MLITVCLYYPNTSDTYPFNIFTVKDYSFCHAHAMSKEAHSILIQLSEYLIISATDVINSHQNFKNVLEALRKKRVLIF
jgi:hypothetical protein